MKHRVAVIEFAHESNTFTINRTKLNAFCSSRYLSGDKVLNALNGTASEIGGAIVAARNHNWNLIPIVSAHAQPGGPVTEETRQEITANILERLRAEGPFDGVFIALHGAMVTQSSQDGESQLLTAVRSVVGNIPIATTFDLHANIFDEMARLINIAISYRTYPHVDMYERAIEACDLLHRTMTGEINPQVIMSRPPMLVGCDDGRTTNDGPMCRILEHAAQEMQSDGILNVAVNAGFTDADVAAAGPSVLITYDTQLVSAEAADSVAKRVCDTIWGYRDVWETPVKLETCIARLQSHDPDGKPVVVADFSDNTGSGAYGDCTAILAALIDAGLRNVALGALCDPEAADVLTKAGIGAEVTLMIGGKTDPSVGGGPLELTGTVAALSEGHFTYEGPMLAGVTGELGPSVCFRTHGIDVMITTAPFQMHDQNLFRAVGVEPSEKAIVVVKSMQHFRGAFEPIASQVIVTDAGGLCTPDVTLRTYKNLRGPIFPLDHADA